MSKEMREHMDRFKNLFINEDFNGNETDIEILYKNHPELSKIGTPEQYSNYIKSIFPSSGVKNIVYHDTRSEGVEGGKLRPSNIGTYGEGIYVQTRRELTGVFGPKRYFWLLTLKKLFHIITLVLNKQIHIGIKFVKNTELLKSPIGLRMLKQNLKSMSLI